MSIDEFDTPPTLVDKMVQVADLLCQKEPRIVADFAVGTGGLLEAAELRWPEATVFGCDISNCRVAKLARAKTDWIVAQCDFLDLASRASVHYLEIIKSKVDLAIINPPFSARGGTRVDVHVDGLRVRCSPAMAFVLLAAQYLSPDGNLVVLLPAGAPYADRDQGAREALRQLGEFRVKHETTAKFPGVSLKVTIAYLKRGPVSQIPSPSIDPVVGAAWPMVKVLRGTLQIHEIPENGIEESIPLVHSTELQDYGLQLTHRVVPAGTRSLSGPAVLLHRVGKPRQDKIAYVPNGSPFAMTDCVFALLCSSEEECLRLHRSLSDQFDLLERNYVGSGAPYITIQRVRRVLHTLGFGSESTNWQEVARRGLID